MTRTLCLTVLLGVAGNTGFLREYFEAASRVLSGHVDELSLCLELLQINVQSCLNIKLQDDRIPMPLTEAERPPRLGCEMRQPAKLWDLVSQQDRRGSHLSEREANYRPL